MKEAVREAGGTADAGMRRSGHGSQGNGGRDNTVRSLVLVVTVLLLVFGRG